MDSTVVSKKGRPREGTSSSKTSLKPVHHRTVDARDPDHADHVEPDKGRMQRKDRPQGKEGQSEYKSARALFTATGEAVTSNASKGTSKGRRKRKKEDTPVKMKTVVAGPPEKESNRRAANSWTRNNDSQSSREPKTLGPVVRKKAERVQLNGYECAECVAYYKTFDLTPEQLAEKLKKCSRHRAMVSPPKTPEHFWEIEFPDTPECIRRGYMSGSQESGRRSLEEGNGTEKEDKASATRRRTDSPSPPPAIDSDDSF
jgi:hypothetical protein